MWDRLLTNCNVATMDPAVPGATGDLVLEWARRADAGPFSSVAVLVSSRSQVATRRTSSWSMPSTVGPDVRVASALSYRDTMRRASSRSASRIDRPAFSSSSSG